MNKVIRYAALGITTLIKLPFKILFGFASIWALAIIINEVCSRIANWVMGLF